MDLTYGGVMLSKPLCSREKCAVGFHGNGFSIFVNCGVIIFKCMLICCNDCQMLISKNYNRLRRILTPKLFFCGGYLHMPRLNRQSQKKLRSRRDTQGKAGFLLAGVLTLKRHLLLIALVCQT
uniref:Uncharacterized protein n=1 Tax=Opuntia streptacantha TaxID=393608 RepID=A0A7C8Z247_OPUST